jgi:excisionase family DNA binding protein
LRLCEVVVDDGAVDTGRHCRAQEPEYVLDDEPAVYTVREVARLLSLSLSTTYELLRAGEIPATRLGHRWIIPRSRFHAWLDTCTEGAS